MPHIRIDIGKQEDAVKEELMKKITEVASEITKLPKEAFLVFVNEFEDDNICVGGTTVTELKKQRMAGK